MAYLVGLIDGWTDGWMDVGQTKRRHGQKGEEPSKYENKSNCIHGVGPLGRSLSKQMSDYGTRVK